MKLTRFFLFFVLFSFCVSAQNSPGIDYFPHIGFFDFIVNYKSPPNDLSSAGQIAKMTEDNGYYFNKLIELGMTNFVSDGQVHTDSLAIPSPFRINDMGFSWKAETHNFNPSIYMNAIGHDKEAYALDFGGTPVGNIEPIAANYGFVRPGENRTNYWSMTPGDLPLNIDSTGFNGSEQIGLTTIHFRGVRTATNEPGAMVWGKLPPAQFPFANLNHLMKIRIRKLNTGGENIEAIRVIISSIPLNELNIKKFYSNVYKNGFCPDVNLAPLGLQQAVSDTAIHWINDYGWFETQMFTLKKSEQLYFAILWPGNIDLNIDKIAIMTQKYDELFEVDSISTELFMDNIHSDIVSQYGSDPGPVIQDFYFDEPFLLTARYRSKLQQRIREAYPGYNTMHLNGATGNVPEYFHRFENKYARESITQPVGNYVLYDMYPFSENDGYGQTTVQDRLDELVSWPAFGSAHAQYDYSYAGLRPALMAANQYDSDSTNDVPLFMTLQVQAEHQVIGGDYVPTAGGKRKPSRNEIFAMGNVSLAYGVKGFMYYMVPTRCELKGTDTIWGTYGLFDDSLNVFNLNQGTGLVQNPANKQIPNERYFAVRDFINSTNIIDSTLLGLRWQDAKSWNTTTICSVNWITNLSTRYPHFATDDDANKTFVETGYFLEKSPPPGKVEDAKFIYLVNRRCNLQPENTPDNFEDNPDTSYRNVKFYLNFPNSPWDIYTVTDLKTDSVYCTTKTGDVTIFLGAGEGTLLKIEPQITHITQDTTLSQSLTLYSDLTVSNNATLLIEDGVTVTFQNHSRLLLSNGNLTVTGTAQEPVVFDFVTPYWQSTTNGIVNNYGNFVLNHAKIKNAAVGYYSYSTDNDDIQNSEIFNNQWGIVMHWTHSYGTEKAKIINCNIHNNSTWDNQGRGITLSNSSPQIYATTIRKNDYGLYCTTNSNPYDTYDEAESYNIIDSNDVGIISYYSTPMLGFVEDEQGDIFYLGGGNTIKDNSLFNVKSYDYSNIYVERDYWGTKDTSLFNIYSDSTSWINTDYYLDDPPSGSIQSGLASKTTMKIDAEWMPPSQGNFTSGGRSNLLRAARKQIRLGNMTAARAILLPLLNNPENMQMSCEALEIYGKTYHPEDIESFFSVLLSVGNRPVKNDLTAKALFLLSEYQTERKETHLTNLISVYQGTDHAARASYLKIVHLVGEGNPMEEIYALKNDMNRLYPLSSYTKEVNYLIVSGTNMMKPSTATTTETLPLEYQLFNNFPNPFNPETVIKFSLKERSNVTLDVFNIAGQKVAELVTGEMEKGMYEKRFNGTKLSSGVYIFRLSAQSLESTTFYTKTMKALLLK